MKYSNRTVTNTATVHAAGGGFLKEEPKVGAIIAGLANGWYY